MVALKQLSAEDRALVERFEAAGQGQVFRFLDELVPRDAAALLSDARQVDLTRLARLLSEREAVHRPPALEPPGMEFVRLGRSDDVRRLRNAAHERGVEDVAAGRVAVVVAAGGQGTRLGSEAPKAMWPVGPASGKPLLQWHAEKVLYWSRQVGRPIPFVVMVSEATRQATEDFLRWHRHFGLDPTWVKTPVQGSMPAVDDEGRVLLATPARIAMAPDGHGGLYRALADSSLLDLLRDHGVQTLSYVQVDNPLVRTLDPVFVGFHLRRESQMSSKSVEKRAPDEKVGVFARADGRSVVVEYTELTEERARAVDQEGALVFGHGSIAAHCIDLEFARRVAETGLPYHRARKRVPHVDEHGEPVPPERQEAWKFECFLFDALPLAERTLVLETQRRDEFSPIKNSSGEDSPETARRDLVAMFAGWYQRAGLPVPQGALEVDPSVAPDEHAFCHLHGKPW
jgi:UDP-N-acetylglucosamine/UDP-N-acetylgalactosamine diphosphorylase